MGMHGSEKGEPDLLGHCNLHNIMLCMPSLVNTQSLYNMYYTPVHFIESVKVITCVRVEEMVACKLRII